MELGLAIRKVGTAKPTRRGCIVANCQDTVAWVESAQRSSEPDATDWTHKFEKIDVVAWIDHGDRKSPGVAKGMVGSAHLLLARIRLGYKVRDSGDQ